MGNVKKAEILLPFLLCLVHWIYFGVPNKLKNRYKSNRLIILTKPKTATRGMVRATHHKKPRC